MAGSSRLRIAAIVLLAASLLFAAPDIVSGQIRVHPTGVNVNSQGATTVFLTFGRLGGFVPAEGLWCGEVVVTTESGSRCDPTTIYGVLPARYDRSALSGNDAFTDIMSIPPSVTRRAFEAASRGRNAEFFYVRRFVNPTGGADQYVAVTCRLTGGGARVPLSLVDVRLAFDVETPVLQVTRGGPVSPFTAEIQYTGTGLLRGRWEVVLPGQELPTSRDLLTEATLPAESRGTQRRFAEIERFAVFLPPTGRTVLKGPDPAKLPAGVDGVYAILLRIEATDDKEADSDLRAVGAGSSVVHAGGVAGFPMPVLRYVVGNGGSELSPVDERTLGDVSPADGFVFGGADAVDLTWPAVTGVLYYRLELEAIGRSLHMAFVDAASPTYRVPPFVLEKSQGTEITWRVVAIDGAGRTLAEGTRRRFVVQSK